MKDEESTASTPSNASTIPISPSEWATPTLRGKIQTDFARLRPLSELAKEAFRTVVERMKDDALFASNARRFLVVSDHETDTGHYRFSMTTPPLSLDAGWVVGSDERTDILLVDPTSDLATASRVSHRHCQIAFGPHSDALLVRCQRGKEVIVNGLDIVRFEPHMLARQTGLQIGTLTYIFEYIEDFPQDIFREQLREFRQRRGFSEPEIIPALTPTPGADAVYYQGFHIEKATFYGASATVSFGRRITSSEPVVAKRIKVTRSLVDATRNEILNLQTLKHPNIVRLAADFRPDPAVFSGFDSPMLDVILILEPAMPQTLDNVIRSGRSSLPTSLYLLRDVLDALSYLHNLNYMHSDIKPGNIGVSIPHTELGCAKAVLLDLGHTRVTNVSRDHMLGTISYLAPEVIALKRDKSAPAFDKSADIWSAGLSFVELLLRNNISHRWKGLGITTHDYTRLMADWDKVKARATGLSVNAVKSSPPEMFDVLDAMLDWVPKRRLKASEALEMLKESVFQIDSDRAITDAGAEEGSRSDEPLEKRLRR